jgi:hypothetical protein
MVKRVYLGMPGDIGHHDASLLGACHDAGNWHGTDSQCWRGQISPPGHFEAGARPYRYPDNR